MKNLKHIACFVLATILLIPTKGQVVSEKNSSMTCKASTSEVMELIGKGCKHEKALCIEVKSESITKNQEITSFEILLKGTTEIIDIDSIQIFYTGKSKEFYRRYSDTLQFGKAKVKNNKVTISGKMSIDKGSNYYWITINVNEKANEGNRVSVAVNSIKFSNGTKIKPEIVEPIKPQEIILAHEPLFISGKENTSCYRIPAIGKAPNGDLLAVIDQRVPNCSDLYPNHNINCVYRRSTDNGKTWSSIQTIADFPDGESASDPSLIVDKMTNSIFVFYNYMNLDTAKRVYYFFVQKSDDNGHTWTRPINITNQIALPEWRKDLKFITSAGGIQLRNGGYRHCMANLEHGLKMFGSDDHGKTWWVRTSNINAIDESKIVELDDGSLMINSRVNNETDKSARIVSISKDDGQNWVSQIDTTLVDSKCNADLVRYSSVKGGQPKSILLFSNANSPRPNRQNLTIRISYDEGKTWTKGKVINSGSSAYSSLVVLNDGSIGVFYEANEYKENRFARFSLKWLISE